MTITARGRDGRLRLTDAGIETVLIFDHGVDLPSFAAFPLLDDPVGSAALAAYARSFLELAGSRGAGFVLETPTWRANPSWGPAVGYDGDALRRIAFDAVSAARAAVAETGAEDVLVSGCVGPRGDGYRPGDTMTADEAADFHGAQVADLADAGADLVTSFTFSYAAEGVGFAAAAAEAGIPAVVGFTLETDGRLASGETLRSAVAAVDEATGGYPVWFMVNCAHPDHLRPALDWGEDWTARIGALRANASRRSHAELDEAEVLDSGDPVELAADYEELQGLLPGLGVVGGCCGTDLRHITQLADRLLA
ncbi:MAG TPA: homocysteine S-methyltransferase family protein [Candidatus Nanopelagicales bacterium]|nr:homocysteine S-methyltransferase family protein [Candidatus Nanopelagicales bacterium]